MIRIPAWELWGQGVVGSADAGIEPPDDSDSGNGGDPVDYFFAASHLLDLVPTHGRDAIWRGVPSKLCSNATRRSAWRPNHVFVLEELRQRIESERDRLSREVFHTLLESGRMRFLVVAEEFTRLPEKIEVPKAKQGNREDGSDYQRNLFDITTEDDLNQIREQGGDVPGPAGAALLLVP